MFIMDSVLVEIEGMEWSPAHPPTTEVSVLSWLNQVVFISAGLVQHQVIFFSACFAQLQVSFDSIGPVQPHLRCLPSAPQLLLHWLHPAARIYHRLSVP